MTSTRKSNIGSDKPEGNPGDSDVGESPKIDQFAIELRRARELRGLSHSDLHRATGISRSALLAYETSRRKPSIREIRLLCDAIQVTPNRLIYGTEEPFKARKGIQTLAKLKGSPAGLAFSVMGMPLLMGALDEEKAEALLTVIGAMLEANDKDAYRKVVAFSEAMGEELGAGTPAEIAEANKRLSDPEYQRKLQERISKA